jgi:hypothetical protein
MDWKKERRQMQPRIDARMAESVAPKADVGKGEVDPAPQAATGEEGAGHVDGGPKDSAGPGNHYIGSRDLIDDATTLPESQRVSQQPELNIDRTAVQPTTAAVANNCDSKAPSTTQLLELDLIEVDGRVQARAGTESTLIDEYAEAMRKGDEFPPLTVFHDGTTYWLADGFHRHPAALRTGRDNFPCEVKPGELRDAILFAAGANAYHGRQRSNEDKRTAVLKLLNDDEWFDWGDREIARRCNVSHQLVANLRRAAGRATSERSYRNKYGEVGKMSIERIGKGGTSQDSAPQRSVPAEAQTAAPGESVALVQPAVNFAHPADVVVQHEVSPASSKNNQTPDGTLAKSAGSLTEKQAEEERQAAQIAVKTEPTAMAAENERLEAELAVAADGHLEAGTPEALEKIIINAPEGTAFTREFIRQAMHPDAKPERDKRPGERPHQVEDKRKALLKFCKQQEREKEQLAQLYTELCHSVGKEPDLPAPPPPHEAEPSRKVAEDLEHALQGALMSCGIDPTAENVMQAIQAFVAAVLPEPK